MLLEKNPQLGGSTAWSIGSISATGTPHQFAPGIRDRPEDHWRDMARFNGELDARDNDELRRMLRDEMPDAFRWLLALGVRFYGPMPEPPHRKPRMHNVLPNSRSYISHLGGGAARRRRRSAFGARATALVTERGRVTGGRLRDGGRTRRFRARGGVVLAAGDFTNDPELKARYMGPQEAKVEGVNVTATGDGQKLALRARCADRQRRSRARAGAALRSAARHNMVAGLPPWRVLAPHGLGDRPRAERAAAPVHHELRDDGAGAVAEPVRAGRDPGQQTRRRFCDELRRARPGVAGSARQGRLHPARWRLAPQFSAWPHFVSTAPGVAYAYVPDYRRNRADVFTEAPTLDALASKLAMPAAALAGRSRP